MFTLRGDCIPKIDTASGAHRMTAVAGRYLISSGWHSGIVACECEFRWPTCHDEICSFFDRRRWSLLPSSTQLPESDRRHVGSAVDFSYSLSPMSEIFATQTKTPPHRLYIQGGPKKVIPLVHILHCTRGITFLAHPVDGVKWRHIIMLGLGLG